MTLLSQIERPADIKPLTIPQLTTLSQEIREEPRPREDLPLVFRVVRVFRVLRVLRVFPRVELLLAALPKLYFSTPSFDSWTANFWSYE